MTIRMRRKFRRVQTGRAARFGVSSYSSYPRRWRRSLSSCLYKMLIFYSTMMRIRDVASSWHLKTLQVIRRSRSRLFIRG